MALNVFDRGIDAATPPWPNIADPAKWGAKFLMRYSAGVGTNQAADQFKLCGVDELRQAVDAGYDFLANSEWYEGRVAEGAGAGKADAQVDGDFWLKRGLAKGASIYCSWDKAQPNPALHNAVEDYLGAYNQELAGQYHADLYAGDVAIHAMLAAAAIRYGWRAMADSWSQDGDWYQPGTGWLAAAQRLAPVSPAHLVQNGNRWYNGGADEDVILRLPVGSHLEALAGGGTAAGPARPITPSPTVPAPADEYEVRQGDDMADIAAAHGLSLAALEALNPTAGHPMGNFGTIWPGDKLRVAGTAPVAPARLTHVVHDGDNMSAIAAGWHVSLAQLEQANPHAGHPAGNFNAIWPGDVIVHP